MGLEGDEGIDIVAMAQVYIPKATEIVKNQGAPMPTGHYRVNIQTDIKPSALLPYPNEEMTLVCQAKKSFIPWPCKYSLLA